MDIPTTYKNQQAPTVGFIMVTLEEEFDKSFKEVVKSRYKELFDSLKNNGSIDKRSLFFDYCYDEKDINDACEKMVDNRVDGIIYHVLTWPAGETISSLATMLTLGRETRL